MRTALSVIAVAGFATAANAQFSDTGFANNTNPTPQSNQFYTIDDGSSENALGLTDGGTIAWMNYFSVQSGGEIITGINATFGQAGSGTSGVTPGTEFQVHVWGDNDMDPTTGATLLNTTTATASADSIEQDIFQKVAVPNVDVSGFNNVLLGVSVDQLAGFFPAAMDEDQASGGRAWVAGDTTGNFNPDGFVGDVAPLEMDSIGFPAVFLIRGNAVPTPGAIALFGLAGLGACRRRR